MIPLTIRSHYSLMWGTAGIKSICKRAKQLGYDHLALTDTDNLYGLWPFLQACKDENITPIVGAELTDPKTRHRAVCLVKNYAGYANLCRLITRRHMDKSFDLFSATQNHGNGLCVLSKNADLLIKWRQSGLHVAAAMPRRPLSPFHPLCETARKHKIPIVATPGSFFLFPEDFAVHRLLRAISKNTTLSGLSKNDLAPKDAFFASPDQYRDRFAIYPQAIDNTYEIAGQIDFDGPDFGLVMPPWKDPKGKGADACLRKAAYKGAKKKYGHDLGEAVVNRLEHELKIIRRMNFSAYFLVVKDIVTKSPRTCGRGSGAASLVAYCLGITNVCPVKHNLYFERFLNPGRKDPPDIDVDFAWDERDAVINHVLDRFKGRSAMVSSHILFQPRMAIRETAKVFGLGEAEISRVSKKLPWFFRSKELEAGLMENLKQRPETKHLELSRPWPEIIGLAQKIIGIPRYMSVHPGGVVITPKSLETYVPIERSTKGVPIIQWEKDSAEDAGLVKIDLLGNRSLGVIRDAVKNIRENQISFDETKWEPEDDRATRDAIAKGLTMGCFYIESPATRLLQQKAGKGDFNHLVIHSSIIRPAANEFIQEYIKRLRGAPWDPIHPLLADVLDETFGIMVYQEDVSRTAVAMAGFSHSDADGLRKIMSKKDKHRKLQDYYHQFANGAKDRGVSRKQIDRVWKMMMSFSGYSFCKPHSASYAKVSFQSAWLKVHHPAEFMAGVISNQGGFYSTFAYVSEARRMGLCIIAPHINKSRIKWMGKGKNLFVGLMAIKGLSKKTMKRIVSSRKKMPFQTPPDVFKKARPDESEARALIHSGAMDCFGKGINRSALMWELAVWLDEKQKKSEKPDIFNMAGMSNIPTPHLPEGNKKNQLRREFVVLGFLCDRHPITFFADAIKKNHTTKAVNLPHHVGRHINFAGWLITGKVVSTKQNKPMEFLTFEDETGMVETTFFPTAYKKFCHMIDFGRPYLLWGKVEQNFGAVTLTVENVRALRIQKEGGV